MNSTAVLHASYTALSQTPSERDNLCSSTPSFNETDRGDYMTWRKSTVIFFFFFMLCHDKFCLCFFFIDILAMEWNSEV